MKITYKQYPKLTPTNLDKLNPDCFDALETLEQSELDKKWERNRKLIVRLVTCVIAGMAIHFVHSWYLTILP